MTSWRATNAKAKFSEVLDKAETQGPQRIERRKQRFILVTEQEYAENGKKHGETTATSFVSAWGALAPSFPERYDDVEFPRMRGKMREKHLG